MNKVCITGRIANDLDMRQTINGKSVMDISVAVDDGKNAKGEKVASFVPVTVWNGSAEYLNNYAHKGTLISVTGRIKVDSYETDGQKRKKVYVTAESVEILAQPQNEGSSKMAGSRADSGKSVDIKPDDLPFEEETPW